MNARLEKLLLQRKQVEAKIKLAKERDRKQERKAETRRKIVLGGYLRERMNREPKLESEVLEALDRLLDRDVDRELFGFELRATQTENGSQTAMTRSSKSERREPISETGDIGAVEKADQEKRHRDLARELTTGKPLTTEDEEKRKELARQLTTRGTGRS